MSEWALRLSTEPIVATTMQQMMVSVPAGVSPGMSFQVNTPAGPMVVQCPAGVSAGSGLIVNVPAVSVPAGMPPQAVAQATLVAQQAVGSPELAV